MDLYIYYRVLTELASQLQVRVESMQTCLSQEYGIVVGLKRRPEEKDGRQTWMEIYQAVPADFETALESAVARAGLPDLIDGPRHIENFVDIASCA